MVKQILSEHIYARKEEHGWDLKYTVMISKSQLTREPVSFLEEEGHVPVSQF